MNADFPDRELALTDAVMDAVESQSWRSLILTGYLPYWSWRSRRFEWQPSNALQDEWARLGEIG